MVRPAFAVKAALHAAWPDDQSDCYHEQVVEVALEGLSKAGYVVVRREVLAEFVDEDPCRFDHHGTCQTHNMGMHGGVCSVDLLRDVLCVPRWDEFEAPSD